jgi:hypothetical protein
MKPLLPWKGNRYYIFLCVCVCEGIFVRAFVRPCDCGCGSTSAGLCLRACSLIYPACHKQSPYCLRLLWLHGIFRHYLINGTNFEKKKLLNIKCVFWFSLQLLFETFLILSSSSSSSSQSGEGFHGGPCILTRIKRDIFIIAKTSSCKEHIILCRTSVKLEFSRQSFEKVSNIRTLPVGTELFHADGQTGVTNLIAAFRKFCEKRLIKWNRCWLRILRTATLGLYSALCGRQTD